jgi:outer membrane biosynthesis protein TonB
MTVRPPLHALLVALLLGALCAFAVACGEERSGLISAERAAKLQDDLDKIDEYVAAGRCEAAEANLQALRRKVNDLPGTVDRDLRERLREGVQHLEQQVPEECDLGTETTETQPETVPQETTPETTPTETTPTETAPTETTPPETAPTETTPPETAPAPEPTPQPEPTPEPPGTSGGEEAPLGAVVEEAP